MGGRSAEASGNRCRMHRPPGQLCSAVRSGHRLGLPLPMREHVNPGPREGGVAGMGVQVCGPSVK